MDPSPLDKVFKYNCVNEENIEPENLKANYEWIKRQLSNIWEGIKRELGYN